MHWEPDLQESKPNTNPEQLKLIGIEHDADPQ